MRTSNSFTAFVTGLAFLLQTGLGQFQSASAQTTAVNGPISSNLTAAGMRIPNATPVDFNTNLVMNSVQSQMAACQAKSLTDDPNIKTGIAMLGDLLTKNKKSSTAKTAEKGAPPENCYSDTYSGKFEKLNSPTVDMCKLKCEPQADLLAKNSCEDFFGESQQISEKKGDFQTTSTVYDKSKDALDEITGNKKNITRYVAFLQFKSDHCTSEDYNHLLKLRDAYQCSVNVLKGATASASGQLQSVLQQNQEMYGKMVQFQQEVGDQVRQIDDILGPDKEVGSVGGNQFQGLLGMQRELNKEMPDMIQKESAFKAQAEQVKQHQFAADQTLEADRMGQVIDCMKGNRNLGVAGGRSLTCFKPTMRTTADSSGKQNSTPALDAAGNIIYSKQACGALEYVRSQVEQSAYITARGVIRSQARTELSQNNVAAFDSMVNSMIRDMGGFDKATDAGKMVGFQTKWSDLSAKYAGDMSEITSLTGVNMQAQMAAVAGSCYKSGELWRTQQIKSAASDYNKSKASIDQERSKLTSEMDAGLSNLNKLYGESISLLGNQAVSLDRSACTTTDPSKMQKCYGDIRKQVSDLLEGNGKSVTTKTFTGGTYVGGFAVPCKGINGCVTVLQKVRTQKKEQNATAQKAKIDFVNKGNVALQKQLATLGQGLNQIQQSALSQFDGMKLLLAKMQVTGGGNLKFMDPEQLHPSESADKTQGPFESPKNMSAVLSGLTQPTGLINFQEGGIEDLMKAAAEKNKTDKDALKETMAKYNEASASLQKLAKCKPAGGKTVAVGDKNVDNDSGGSNCPGVKKAIEAKKKSDIGVGDWITAMASAITGVTGATASAPSAEDKKLMSEGLDCDLANASKPAASGDNTKGVVRVQAGK